MVSDPGLLVACTVQTQLTSSDTFVFNVNWCTSCSPLSTVSPTCMRLSLCQSVFSIAPRHIVFYAGAVAAQRQDEALDSLMLSSNLQPVNDPIPRCATI